VPASITAPDYPNLPPDDLDHRTGSGYEPLHDASVYDTDVDLEDDDGAHRLIVDFTGENKRVLELGCATGSTTKVLAQRGCQVVGIEVDGAAAALASQFCERVIVGDLDLLDVDDALGDDTFDVIIAADVLEHLRDPRRALMACVRHLRPGGEVLISIPNVAHADVRFALLRGDFNYQWCGILDETHMRFFTRRTFEEFLTSSGLVALQWDRTQRPIGQTEIEWRPVDERLLDEVADQPDADTYQFVVRAAAAAEGSHVRELGDRLDGLRAAGDENKRLRGDNARLVEALEKLELMVAELQAAAALSAEHQAEARALRAELRDAWDEVATVAGELDAYRTSFETLAGVQEELVAVRRSESYRVGNALLSPLVTARRVGRAWRRAKSPG
jgi:2-polyprenyl-3-methyl-5-hydroxy-6-metoxy-1,4-benzoquinol methylase